MGAAGGATMKCPTCHMDVAAQPRCEMCGSALPPMTAPPSGQEGDRTIDPPLPKPDEPELQDEQAFEPAEGMDEAPPVPEPDPAWIETPPDRAEDETPAEAPSSAFDEPGADVEPPPPDDPRPDEPRRPDPKPQPFVHGSDPSRPSGPEPTPRPAPVPPPTPGPRPGPVGPTPSPAAGANALLRRLFLDFQFAGRMARPDYWKMFAIRAGIVLICILLAAQGMTGGETGGDMGGYPGGDMGGYPGEDMGDYQDAGTGEDALLGLLAGLLAIWVSISGIAQAARRLHDTGRSGWWNLILLIPYVGFIVLLFLLAQEGKPGDNEYGPVPDAAPGPWPAG